MRRASSVLLLALVLSSLAASAGAIRCACCAPGAATVMKTAEWCCPDGDGSRCASPAAKPAPAWTALAETPRPALLPAHDPAISPFDGLAFLELRFLAGKPSGREGLTLRSILRL
jgi:hypothetical protein